MDDLFPPLNLLFKRIDDSKWIHLQAGWTTEPPRAKSVCFMALVNLQFESCSGHIFADRHLGIDIVTDFILKASSVTCGQTFCKMV